MAVRLSLLCLLLVVTFPASAENDAAAAATSTDIQRLRQQAAKGDARAQYNLGVRYNDGRGVPLDYSQAAKWYRRAAIQGYMPAQYNLGVLYGNGKGVAHDIIEAHMWFSLAAASGDAQAIENRDRTERILTPEQLDEARKLAHEWMETYQPRK